ASRPGENGFVGTRTFKAPPGNGAVLSRGFGAYAPAGSRRPVRTDPQARRLNPAGFSFALVGPGDLLALPLRPLVSRCDRFRRPGKPARPTAVRTVFER